jgi:hypothetical protein
MTKAGQKQLEAEPKRGGTHTFAGFRLAFACLLTYSLDPCSYD